MGRHNARQREQANLQRNTVNPYMRGIGCLFMVIIPIFSYAVGNELAKQNFGWQFLPSSWYIAMDFPPIFYQVSGLSVIAGWLGSIPRLPAALAIGTVIAVIVGGIISIVYGYMYNIMAPHKRGPMDIPPPRVKTKKYKR